MTSQKTQKRKSLVIFLIILILSIIAGILTFMFLTRINNTVEVYYVKNQEGLLAFQQITEDDIGVVAIHADALALMAGDDFRYAYLANSEEETATPVGSFARIPMGYGEVFLQYKTEKADDKGRYRAGLYEAPGTRLLTFDVPLVRALSGQFVPGDFMDVYYTDEETGATERLMAMVEILDVRYGSNIFKPQSGTDEESDEGTVRDPLANNINPDLGDKAVFVVMVPTASVSQLAPKLVKSESLFLVATVPPPVVSETTTPTADPAPVENND